MRITKVALALAVFFLMTSAGFAQAPSWQGNSNDRWGNWGYQEGHDKAYDRGVRDGREDREHRRSWHPRKQGQAYLNGYRAGFGTDAGGHRDGDHDRDDKYRGNEGSYGPYGGYEANHPQRVAYSNGYQQGLNYGTTDRSSGHSNRPTYSSMYRDGTNGYNSSMGDKHVYRAAFQQGFAAGYERGFNGGERR